MRLIHCLYRYNTLNVALLQAPGNNFYGVTMSIKNDVAADIAAEKSLYAHNMLESVGSCSGIDVVDAISHGDAGYIYLMVLLGKGHYLYDPVDKHWYRWGEHCWLRDLNESVYNELPKKLGKVLKEARGKAEQLSEGNYKSARIASIDAALKRLLSIDTTNKFVTNTIKGRSISELDEFDNSSELAGLGINGTEWDANRHLLGFINGVLDLKTGEFRPGKPEDYLNALIPHEWKGWNTPAPNFEKYLSTSLPKDITHPELGGDTEVIGCLQRCIGHTFGGELKEHMLVVLSGQRGRNGKTTLFEALKYAFGDQYVTAAQSSLLTKSTFARSSSAPSPDLMNLRGARIAYASEVRKGAEMDCEQVKHITGGDTITARPLYGQNVSFKPTHQLFLLANDIPQIAYDDLAMWYRLRIFEFPLSYVDTPTELYERKADKELMSRLQQEASGIIAWVLMGYRDYCKQGINPPESVKASVREFQKKNDVIGLFIQETLVRGEDSTIQATKLYGAYKKWAREANVPEIMSSTRFGEQMADRISKKKTASGMVYTGYRLAAQN